MRRSIRRRCVTFTLGQSLMEPGPPPCCYAFTLHLPRQVLEGYTVEFTADAVVVELWRGQPLPPPGAGGWLCLELPLGQVRAQVRVGHRSGEADDEALLTLEIVRLEQGGALLLANRLHHDPASAAGLPPPEP